MSMFFLFVFCLVYGITRLQEGQQLQFVLTKGKIIPKQHKNCRGFCLWEQMAALKPPQSLHSAEPRLNQQLITWIYRKTSLHEDLGAWVRAQLLCSRLSASHGVTNQVVISHCFTWNQSKSVSLCSFALQRGIPACGRRMGIQRSSGWVHWIQF